MQPCGRGLRAHAEVPAGQRPCKIVSCLEGQCVTDSPCHGGPCRNSQCSQISGPPYYSCTYTNRDGSCPDDGNACSDDWCFNGVCSHPCWAGCSLCAQRMLRLRWRRVHASHHRVQPLRTRGILLAARLVGISVPVY
ncbi:MAG: hypothetical protein HYR83_05585 [Planctomycetes bacterium]|nr:hypothetical protein [Planctomycetota bacterium]